MLPSWIHLGIHTHIWPKPQASCPSSTSQSKAFWCFWTNQVDQALLFLKPESWQNFKKVHLSLFSFSIETRFSSYEHASFLQPICEWLLSFHWRPLPLKNHFVLCIKKPDKHEVTESLYYIIVYDRGFEKLVARKFAEKKITIKVHLYF